MLYHWAIPPLPVVQRLIYIFISQEDVILVPVFHEKDGEQHWSREMENVQQGSSSKLKLEIFGKSFENIVNTRLDEFSQIDSKWTLLHSEDKQKLYT